MRICIGFLMVFLPWRIRRWILTKFWGYEIDPTAKIGWSWVFPRLLVMGTHSRIGHGTVIKGVDRVVLGEFSEIGRLNWITGEPRNSISFSHQERVPELVLGIHAAITHRHLIDCTDSVQIGAYSIVAGFRSQILTHSIDLATSQQCCAPIRIGEYCFVGTAVVILGGGVLPSFSVLGAKALLNRQWEESYGLYAGVPAKRVSEVARDAAYFYRKQGYVK